MPDAIVVGGAAGMWGDSSLATPQLLRDGRCKYLIYESLAEITMAVLTKAKLKDPHQGYARDVISIIGEHLAEFASQGIKVITNAGGVNPEDAAAALRAMAAARGVEIRIGTVAGDDLRDQVDRLRADGIADMSTDDALPHNPLSINAYLGARPIAAALHAGADVVITGRCVDSALTLAPLIHEFGWSQTDLDQLSQGSLAGHLLECGPQATGGLLTDWRDTVSWAECGYPIAEVAADGSFVLTTPAGSDGLVDRRTVTEQLIYEIGDPAAYLLPDVVCDWTGVHVTEEGTNRVRVSGARGRPPTPTYKACAQILDGYRAQTLTLIAGREAVPKARRLAADALTRFRRMLAAAEQPDFRATHVEVLGAEDTYGEHARGAHSREVLLKLAMHHDDPAALTAIIREYPSLGFAPPGLSGGGSGLPRVSPLIRLGSYLIPRSAAIAEVRVDDRLVQLADVAESLCRPLESSYQPAGNIRAAEYTAPHPDEPTVTLPLIAIAHGRSGDKGAHSNIGVIARAPEFEGLILDQLTESTVAAWMRHLAPTRTVRYRLPGIAAVNFMLYDALGAGGTASLRFDPQGKAAAQQLLELPIQVPAALLTHPALSAIPEVAAARTSLAPSSSGVL